MIENHGISIFRTNPDAADFNMNRLINQIHNHIIELTKKQTKKSLVDDLSKGLLELEFKSNYLIKSKCLKWAVKTYYQNTKNEKHTIKNKINKNWKTTSNNILLWVQKLFAEFQTRKSENGKRFVDQINQFF